MYPIPSHWGSQTLAVAKAAAVCGPYGVKWNVPSKRRIGDFGEKGIQRVCVERTIKIQGWELKDSMLLILYNYVVDGIDSRCSPFFFFIRGLSEDRG